MPTLDQMLAGDASPWLDALSADTRASLARHLNEHRDPEVAAAAWLCDRLEPDRAGQAREELEEEARTLVGSLRQELAQHLCAGRYAGERATMANRASGAAVVIVAEISALLAAHGGVPEAIATPIAAMLLAQAAVIGRRAFCRHAARSRDSHQDRGFESYRFDVALSYATEDRVYVRRVAEVLDEHGIAVFYDQFFEAELWGANLAVYFDEVYRTGSRLVVVFASADYARKSWPMRELQSALEGAILQRRESVLSARLDDTRLPGLLAMLGSVNCQNRTPETLASVLIEKVARTAPRSP
jgi:TIR domain-containing protein